MFTIIIPVFNRGEILSECLQSCISVASAIVSEGLERPEILVVDDGSNDYYQKKIEVMCAKYSVQLITSPTNRGAISARVIGASNAAYPAVTFLDSDNFLRPIPGSLVIRIVDVVARGGGVFFPTTLETGRILGVKFYLQRGELRLKDEINRDAPEMQMFCSAQAFLESFSNNRWRRIESPGYYKLLDSMAFKVIIFYDIRVYSLREGDDRLSLTLYKTRKNCLEVITAGISNVYNYSGIMDLQTIFKIMIRIIYATIRFAYAKI